MIAITPHWLSFGVGFLSLSQEILWMRLYGYASESMPQAMMAVLVAYLAGIAAGAAAGKDYCTGETSAQWRAAGRILLGAAVFDVAALVLFALAASAAGHKPIGMVLIFATAAFKAAVFPLAHHLGVGDRVERIGHSFSKVYAFNVAGATLGPAVTGFLVLGVLGTQQSLLLCAFGSAGVGLLCLSRPRATTSRSRLDASAGIAAMGIAAGLAFLPDILVSSVSGSDGTGLRRLVETRQGVVASFHGGIQGDIITGGNVYDGTTNLDPRVNSNGLDRLLVLPTMQERPRRILLIGLSIGTWLKLVTQFPGVESIDVVEIDPGYLRLIADYPAQASALSDPRVKVHIDDGRRWLRSQPKETRYNLIIINTTYHWRAFSTNLLSVEFLRELESHMSPDAVLSYNATGSPDVLHTAATVFPHVRLYGSFVIASARDYFSYPDDSRRAALLQGLTMDGRPYYHPDDFMSIPRLLGTPFRSLEQVRASAGRPLEIISDRNLATEYRHGRGFFFGGSD
jgi:spermidine synthase